MNTVQKRWFHATTKENWRKIKKEGVLWGIEDEGKLFSDGINGRHTFLARNLEELIEYIYLPFFEDLRKCELVLSVKYTPNRTDDDYDPKSWEMIVKKPILLNNVRVYRYL